MTSRTSNIFTPPPKIFDVSAFINTYVFIFFYPNLLEEALMLLKEYYDHEYQNNGFTHTRLTCRALVFNDLGEMALIHIKGTDIFGERDHYETPGGGIEKGEDHHIALQREVREELAYECVIEDYLGLIINRYNLLKVITAHHYYVARVTLKSVSNLTELEKSLFDKIEWKKPEEWLEVLSKPCHKINKMLHERELFILNYYLNTSKDQLK